MSLSVKSPKILTRSLTLDGKFFVANPLRVQLTTTALSASGRRQVKRLHFKSESIPSRQ